MSTLFKPNALKVCEGALRKCGVLEEGESMNSDQQDTAMEALRALVKAWQTDGLQTWLLTTQDITVTAGKAEYTNVEVGLPKMMRVYHMSSYDIAAKTFTYLNRISIQEYYQMGSRFSESNPNQYCVVTGTEETKFFLYPVPDADFASTCKITVIYQRPSTDLPTTPTPTDILDFPDEWVKALIYGLAADLADEYSLPLKKCQWLEAKAKEAKQDALSWSVEDTSVYFRADQRFGWQFKQD